MNKKNNRYAWRVCFLFMLITVSCYMINKHFVNYKILDYVTFILGIADIIFGFIGIKDSFVMPYINNHKNNYDADKFVDRKTEYKAVINEINSGTTKVYISGRNGIGKTLFLFKLNDMILKKESEISQSKPYSVYVDLKEDTNLKSAIRNSLHINDDLSYPDFTKQLFKITRAKNLIVLVDNVGDEMYIENEETINTILRLSKNIFFVIASQNVNPMYNPIRLSDFSEKEVIEMASALEVRLDDEIIKKILEYSGGLPILIFLFIKQLKLTNQISERPEAKQFIKKICDLLTPQQQQLIATLSFLKLSNEDLEVYYLKKHFKVYTTENIEKLVSCGLIEKTKETVYINKFFASVIREKYEENRFDYYNLFYQISKKSFHNSKNKLLFLLLGNIYDLVDKDIIDSLSFFTKDKEYLFLVYLYKTLDDFHNLNFHYDNIEIRKKLLYCYTHSLFELGEYKRAYAFINGETPWQRDINLRTISTDLEFEFNFDLADMDHFFGDFQLAIDSYEKIRLHEITQEQDIKCLWAIGHCYRHLGDSNSMLEAISCFEYILSLSPSINVSYYIRTYQSLVLIKLFLKDFDYDYEKAFTAMAEILIQNNNIKKLKEIKTSRQYAIYISIVLRDKKRALDLLISSIEELEKSNIRIKYDYYFEYAETLRHKILDEYNSNEIEQCKCFYLKAYNYAARVGDISLHALSQIGLIIIAIMIDESTSKDLDTILEISTFCNSKNIIYILNYCHPIKEYLLNAKYLESKDNLYKQIIQTRLFIM